jgi:hypothetical protein
MKNIKNINGNKKGHYDYGDVIRTKELGSKKLVNDGQIYVRYTKAGSFLGMRNYDSLKFSMRSVYKYISYIKHYYLILSNENHIPEFFLLNIKTIVNIKFILYFIGIFFQKIIKILNYQLLVLMQRIYISFYT